MCWCLPGTCEVLWSRKWWLSRKNCYGRWNLGPLVPAGNQESEQGMAPYPLTKTEKILHTTICSDSLLGWMRANFWALHPRRNTVNSATYADLLKNHLHPAIKSKQCGHLSTCFAPTWQCLAPYCPFNFCKQSKICPLTVFHIYRTHQISPQWLSCLWTTQRGDGRQVFQVWQRGAAGGARVAALSAKKKFFLEVSMHFEMLEHLYGMQWRLHREMKSLCTFCVQ